MKNKLFAMKIKRKYAPALYMIILLLPLFYSCDDTVNPLYYDIPESNVSYSKHIQPLFNLKCTNSGCHDDQTRAGNLSLTSYGNTTADLQIVVPYHPENSVLVWAIEGRIPAGFMPPPTAPVAPLTDNQINGIKTWIKEGARAN